MNRIPFPPRKMIAGFAPLHLAALLWAVVVTAGFAGLFYLTRPGSDSPSSLAWPASSQIARDPSRYTLLVFAHPRCPCTKATLQELSQIVAREGDRFFARVVFLQPKNADPAWGPQSDNWRTAESIPGVKIVRDIEGIEAAKFGAKTSGLTVLFDQSGHSVFRGGITASRGEAGPNAGSEAIVAFLDYRPTKVTWTQAYGCPLFALERKEK